MFDQNFFENLLMTKDFGFSVDTINLGLEFKLSKDQHAFKMDLIYDFVNLK